MVHLVSWIEIHIEKDGDQEPVTAHSIKKGSSYVFE